MGSSRPKILGAYLTERLSVYDCPRELRRGLFRTLWCGAKRTSWCWRSTRSRRASRKRKLTAWRYKCDEQQSRFRPTSPKRSEEHTSELQSQFHLVCRLLLEKKKQHRA